MSAHTAAESQPGSLDGVTGTISWWYVGAAGVCPASLGALIGFPERSRCLCHKIFPECGSLSALLAATLWFCVRQGLGLVSDAGSA